MRTACFEFLLTWWLCCWRWVPPPGRPVWRLWRRVWGSGSSLYAGCYTPPTQSHGLPERSAAPRTQCCGSAPDPPASLPGSSQTETGKRNKPALINSLANRILHPTLFSNEYSMLIYNKNSTSLMCCGCSFLLVFKAVFHLCLVILVRVRYLVIT